MELRRANLSGVCSGSGWPGPSRRDYARRVSGTDGARHLRTGAGAQGTAPAPERHRTRPPVVIVDTALRVERYFGTSPEFRINLQIRRDLDIAESAVRGRIEREIELRTV